MVSPMPSFSELVQHLVQAHELEIMEATQVLTMKLEILDAELHEIRKHAGNGEISNSEATSHKAGRRASRHRNDLSMDRTTSDASAGGRPQEYRRRRSRAHSPSPAPLQAPEASIQEELPSDENKQPAGDSPTQRTDSGGSEEDSPQRPLSASRDSSAPEESSKQQGRDSPNKKEEKAAKRARRKSRLSMGGDMGNAALVGEDKMITFAMPSEGSVGSTNPETTNTSPEPPTDKTEKDAQASPRRASRKKDDPDASPRRGSRKRRDSHSEAPKADDESVLPVSGQPGPLANPDTTPDVDKVDTLPAAVPGSVNEEREEEALESLTMAVRQCLSQSSQSPPEPDHLDNAGDEGGGGAATVADGAGGGGSSSSTADPVETAPAQPMSPMAPPAPPAPMPPIQQISPMPPMQPILQPMQPMSHNGISLGHVQPPQPLTLGPASPGLLQAPQDLLGFPDLSFSKHPSDASGAARMSVVGIVDPMGDSSGQRRVTWCMAPAGLPLGGGLGQPVGVNEAVEDDHDEDEKALELHTVWQKMSRRSLCSGATQITQMRLRGASRQMSQEMLEAQDQSCLDKMARRLISRPGSYRRLAWDVIGMVLIGYDLVAIPLQVFEPPATPVSIFMSWFTIIFWTLDIPSSFLVGFHCEGLVEMRLEKIARHYAKTWLTFDIAVITMDWLISVAGAISASLANNSVSYMRVGRALRFLRLLRLLRIMKVHGVLNDIIELVQSESLLILLGIGKLMVCIVVINHLLACFWYGVGSLDFESTWIKTNYIDDRELAYRYATALHWSLTQFTPASMEVTPRNTAERFFTISVIIFAMVTFSSFISSVTNATTRLRNLNSESVQAQASLRQYLAENKVSMTLMGRIFGSLNQLMNKSKRRLHEKDVAILQLLPWSLKAELQEQVYTPILIVHPFFAHYASVDARSCRKIYQTCLTEVSLGIGQEQFNTHQTAKEMLFVLSGILSYSKSDKPEGLPPGLVSNGQWVSEPVMWVKWKHNGQLLATTHGELLALNTSKAHEVMEHKENAARYAKRFVKFFKENRDALSDIWADMDIIADMTQKAFSTEQEEVVQSCDNKSQYSQDTENRSLFGNFMPQAAGSGRRMSMMGLGHTANRLGGPLAGATTNATPQGSRNGSRRPSMWGASSLFGFGQSNQAPTENESAECSSGSDSESSTESSSGLSSLEEKDDEHEEEDEEEEGKEPKDGENTKSEASSQKHLAANERSALVGCKHGTPVMNRSRSNSLQSQKKEEASEDNNDSEGAVKTTNEPAVKAETPVVVVTDAGDMSVQEAD